MPVGNNGCELGADVIASYNQNVIYVAAWEDCFIIIVNLFFVCGSVLNTDIP